jgi:hypothetical protein
MTTEAQGTGWTDEDIAERVRRHTYHGQYETMLLDDKDAIGLMRALRDQMQARLREQLEVARRGQFVPVEDTTDQITDDDLSLHYLRRDDGDLVYLEGAWHRLPVGYVLCSVQEGASDE